MRILLLGLDPEKIDTHYIKETQDAAPDMRVLVTRDRDPIEEVLDEIEIAAGGFPLDLLSKAPRLRWFQQWGAGADWIMTDHPELADTELIVTTVSGVHAIPISEHILAFLLAFGRDIPRSIRAQERCQWVSRQTMRLFELSGKTMLLVGVGAIGERTAELASALGMRVLGIRRDPTVPVPHVETMYAPSQLLSVLPEADVVVLTIPLTPETQGMIGEEELGAMKSTAYLINIGRGATIQESVLIQALKEGWIAGAGLDVFENEPLPDNSPLWKMDNVIITSHYSGLTPRYDERAMEIFLENLKRYRSGQALRNVVDKRLGY